MALAGSVGLRCFVSEASKGCALWFSPVLCLAFPCHCNGLRSTAGAGQILMVSFYCSLKHVLCFTKTLFFLSRHLPSPTSSHTYNLADLLSSWEGVTVSQDPPQKVLENSAIMLIQYAVVLQDLEYHKAKPPSANRLQMISTKFKKHLTIRSDTRKTRGALEPACASGSRDFGSAGGVTFWSWGSGVRFTAFWATWGSR